jgi:hypothetical protein
MSRRGGSQAKGRLHSNDDESRFPTPFSSFRAHANAGPASPPRATPRHRRSAEPAHRTRCSNAPLQAGESRPEDERWLSHYGLRREARPVHMARNQISQTGLLSTRGGPNVRPDEVNHSFRWQLHVSRTKRILRPPNLNRLSSLPMTRIRGLSLDRSSLGLGLLFPMEYEGGRRLVDGGTARARR